MCDVTTCETFLIHAVLQPILSLKKTVAMTTGVIVLSGEKFTCTTA